MAKRELGRIEKYSVDDLVSGLAKLKSEAVKTDEALDKTKDKIDDLTGSAENLNDTLNDTTSVMKKLFANRKGKNKTFFSDEDKKQAEKFTKNIQDQILANQQLAKLEKSISTGRVKYYTDEANALKHVKKAFEDYQSAISKNKQNDINKKSSDMLRWGHAYEALLPNGVENQLHTLGDEFIKHWNDVKDKVYDKTGGLSMYSKESFREMFDLMKDMEKNGFNFELFKPAQLKNVETIYEIEAKKIADAEKAIADSVAKTKQHLDDLKKTYGSELHDPKGSLSKKKDYISAAKDYIKAGGALEEKEIKYLYQLQSQYNKQASSIDGTIDIGSWLPSDEDIKLKVKELFTTTSSFIEIQIENLEKSVGNMYGQTFAEGIHKILFDISDDQIYSLGENGLLDEIYKYVKGQEGLFLSLLKPTTAIEEQTGVIEEETKAINRNNLSLAEKIAYLKEIQKHYKFMEDAEDKRISMEEKAYDAGGLNPKSEAESLKKIQMYETLCENIEKSNAALDEFVDTYESVIVRMKNGIIYDFGNLVDVDRVKLFKSTVSDIQLIPFMDNLNQEEIIDWQIQQFKYGIGKDNWQYEGLDDKYQELYKSIEKGALDATEAIELFHKAQKNALLYTYESTFEDFEDFYGVKRNKKNIVDFWYDHLGLMQESEPIPDNFIDLSDDEKNRLYKSAGLSVDIINEQVEKQKELIELQEKSQSITTLPLFEESSGQLAFIEGVKEASFTIENSQKNIREEIQETNEVIDGQISLFDLLSEKSKSKFPEYNNYVAYGKERINRLQTIQDKGITDEDTIYSLVSLRNDLFESLSDSYFTKLKTSNNPKQLLEDLIYSVFNDGFPTNGLKNNFRKQCKEIFNIDTTSTGFTGYGLNKIGGEGYWTHFATFDKNSKMRTDTFEDIIFKIYGTFKDINNLNKDTISNIMKALTSAGFKGQLKAPGEYGASKRLGSSDHLVIHGVNKDMQKIAYEVLTKQFSELFSFVSGGFDAPEGSFSQLLASGDIGQYISIKQYYNPNDIKNITEEIKELTQAEIEATEKAKDFGRVFGISNQNALKEISDVVLAYKQTPTIDLKTDKNGYLIADDYDDEFALFEESAMSAGKTIEDVIDVVSKHLKLSKKDVIDYAESWKQVRNYVSNSKILISDKDKADMGNDAASILSTIGRGNIVQKDGIDITKLLEAMNEDLGTTFISLTTTQDAYRELYEFLKYKPLKVNIEGLPDSIREVVGQLLDGTYHGQGKYKVSSPKISSVKFSNQDVIDTVKQEAIISTESTTTIVSNLEKQKRVAQDTANAIVDAENLKQQAYQNSEKVYGDVENTENIMPDASAIKHEYKEKGHMPVKISDTYRIGLGEITEIGRELNQNGALVPFIKNLIDITQLEKEAVKWTNKLTLAYADLNYELRQPDGKQSGIVINALNEQIDEYIDVINIIDNRVKDLAKRPEAKFSYDDYRNKVDTDTNIYKLEIATKTAKQIRIENEKALKAEGKIEQMRSKYRKNASKIDDVFKNTTEYKELERVINSFSNLEDISRVEKAFNNIENVIATFKRNAKGLETLDTVKSALNQKSSLGDEVKQYELKLLSLGYTADEIKDKLSDLYATAKTIQDISLTDADADNNNVVKFGEELKRFYQLKNQLESNIKLETEQGKRTTNLYRELTKLENERYRIKQQLIKLDIDNKSDEVLLNRLRQINAEMLSLTDLKIDLEKLGVTDFHGEDIAFSNLRESHNVQLEDSKRQQLADKEKKSIDELNIIYDNLNQKRKKQYDLEKSLNTLSSKQRTQDAKELENVLREINLLLEERNKLSQYDNTGRRESYETYDLQLQKDLINDIIDAYGNANDKLRLYQAEANTPGNTKSYDAQIQQQKDTVDSLRIAAEQAADEMDRLSKAGKASKQEQWDTRAKFNNATANSDTARKAQDTEQSNKNKQAVIDEKEALDLLKKSLENVVKAYGQLASSAKNGSDSLLFKSNSKIFNDAMQQMQDYVDLAKNVGVSDGKINILQNDYFAKASSSVQQGGISSIDKYLNDIEKVEEKLRESGQLTENAKQNFQGLREVFVNLVFDTDFSDGNELQKFILSLASLGNGLQSELDKISKQSKLTWINDQIQELDKLSYKSDDVKSKLTELKAKVAAYESAKQSGDKELIDKAEIDLLKQAPGLIAKIQQLASGKGNLIDESIGKVNNLEDLNRALLEYAKNHGYVKAMGSSLKASNGEVTGTFIDQNGAVVKLTASMDQMRNAMKLVSTTQQGAVGLFGSFKEALKSAGQSLTFYFSGAALIRRFFGEFRKGIDVLKKYDSALTNISYTMDMSKDQLDTLGQSAVDMAKDLSLSLDNTLKIYQIYANMQTTAEEIAETARPTAILSNLSGVDASTASDQIQGILNQFNMLKDANVDAAATSMHVVDVLDKISANVAIDYAKGIGIITDAVTATGSAAADAGMSYEQLAAVSAKVAERTREDGSSIGNAIKTILTRISKVGKMPGYADEVDNETLSKASESLNEIGIAVYNADGSFRNISVILGELAEKWDGLTDAQQSNISYNVAATRQSNKFRAILEAWTSATELATDATNSFGNAEANQEKYLESYNGKLQQIKTQLDAFWLALFNSDAVSDILDFIIELTKGFNNLAEAITPLGALLVGFTGILGGITAGKYIKGKGLLKFIKDFSLFTYNISDANKGLILFGKSFSNIQADLGSGQGLFYSIFGKNSFKKGDFDALNQYINLLSDPRVSVQNNAYSQTIANTSAAMRAQVAQCGNNIDALRALAATQQTATFGAKALTAAQIALNAVMGTIAIVLVTLAITKLVKVIDNYVHRVENAKEALEEFDSQFADNRNTYKQHADLVKEVSESYDELASKVNTDTNYNLGLNEDEYANFIDMNNQLADAFPTLVKGYDEAGNAIIDFGNDCDSTTEKLNKLIEAEKNAMNIEIASALPEYLKETNVLIKDYNKEITEQEDKIEQLKKTQQLINDINSESLNLFEQQTFSQESLGAEQYTEFYNLMTKSASEFVDTLTQAEKMNLGNLSFSTNDLVRSDGQNIWLDFFTLTPELQSRLQTIIHDNASTLASTINDELFDAQNALQDAELSKEQSWNAFTDNLISGMNSKASFQKLTAAGQQLATTLVKSLDSSVAENMDEEDPYAYVRDNILSVFNTLDDNEINTIVAELNRFNQIDMSTLTITGQEEARQALIDAILSIIPGEQGEELVVSLGLRIETDTQKAYTDFMSDVDSKYGEGYSEKWNSSIQFYLDKYNINSEEELNALRKFFNETGNLTKAFNLYAASIEKTADATDNLTNSNQKFSKLEMIEAINSMSDGFDILDDIYADIIDGKSFDFTNLDKSKFEDAFSGLEEEYGNFIETVSESPTDIKACQEAFDELATAFINNKGILDNLTEENANVAASMLKNMGIANAEEVVTRALAIEKQKLTYSTGELANATYAEVYAKYASAEASSVEQVALAQLALEKINVNENKIDTSEDINQIYNLAEAAMASTEVLAQLSKAKSVLGEFEESGYKYVTDAEVKEAYALIEQINSGKYDFKFQKLNREQFKIASGNSSIYTGAEQSLKAAEDAAKEATDSLVDFFERRVEVLEQAFGNLEAGIQNVLGAKAKNTVLAGQLEILDEETRNYTDAIGMYQKAAEGYLSLIPETYRKAAKNGDISILQINDEQTREAIENYQQWANKVAECTQKLEELKAQIRELELEKFNNIIKDFTDQFDLHGTAIDNIDKQIGLLEEAGELIGSSYYTKQIEQSEKQLALLEQQKLAMVEQLNDSLSSGRIQTGTDEWLEMVNALQEVEGNIIDCKTSIEEFNNALLEIQWIVFERIQTEFGNLNSEIENLAGLFNDFNDIEVSDGKGTWTKEAIATLGLYAQQYELARYQANQYGEAIEKLKQDYLEGKYSATEYMDKLAELSQGQWDAINSAESLEDAIISLNETRVNEEIEAYRELIDAQIELIEQTDKLKKKQDELAEKSKTVADIEKQLAAMMYDNSAATVAKRKQLEAQLADAKKDLSDTEYEYSKDAQIEALNKQFEDQETLLQESLKDRETLLNQSFNTVKENATLVGEQITLIAQQHGVIVSDAVITPWLNGETAIAGYGETLSAQSSVFIGNLIGVENEVIELQNKANVTSVALSNMFATRADNLVGQLRASYYAEDNLNYATDLLHQNLLNTLQGSYNVSGIVNALNAIRNAANEAADALNRASSSGGGSSKTYYHMGSDNKGWYIKDLYGSYKKYYGSFEEASNALDKLKTKNYNYKGYAKGSKRIPEDQLAWTDEHGEREMIIRRSDGAILTRLERGDAIANANLAENLFKWGEINPNRFMQGLGSNTTVSKINVPMKESKPNITLDYDLNIGSFTDGEHLLSTIQKVSKDSATKLLNDINRDFRIHSR